MLMVGAGISIVLEAPIPKMSSGDKTSLHVINIYLSIYIYIYSFRKAATFAQHWLAGDAHAYIHALTNNNDNNNIIIIIVYIIIIIIIVIILIIIMTSRMLTVAVAGVLLCSAIQLAARIIMIMIIT